MRTVTVDGSATVDDVVLEQILIVLNSVVVSSPRPPLVLDVHLPQRTTNHAMHLCSI